MNTWGGWIWCFIKITTWISITNFTGLKLQKLSQAHQNRLLCYILLLLIWQKHPNIHGQETTRNKSTLVTVSSISRDHNYTKIFSTTPQKKIISQAMRTCSLAGQCSSYHHYIDLATRDDYWQLNCAENKEATK